MSDLPDYRSPGPRGPDDEPADPDLELLDRRAELTAATPVDTAALSALHRADSRLAVPAELPG